MADREKVIAWLADEELYYRDHGDTHNSLMACYALAMLKEQEDLGTELTNAMELIHKKNERIEKLLKEQEDLKQKMWNALYAEEDKLEKKFIGTEEHDDWFTVYRPWLQRGFEIAIKVIAEKDGM